MNYTNYFVSTPSNGSIQFLQKRHRFCCQSCPEESQSPQTGQFNSYKKDSLGQDTEQDKEVSIPSNGSIQFLQEYNDWINDNTEREVSIPSNGSIQFLRSTGGKIVRI